MPLALPQNEVDLVSKALNGQSITKLRQTDETAVCSALSLEIGDCARNFLGAVNTTDEGVEAMIELVLSNFGHLGLGEVRQAFVLLAAGKLGCDVSAYYGIFSVVAFGQILGFYCEYRKQIFDAVKPVEASTVPRLDDGVSEQWKLERIQKLTSTQVSHQHVTVYDFEFLVERGEITVRGDKEARTRIYGRAGEILDAETRAAMLKNENRMQRRGLEIEISDYAAGNPSSNWVARQKALAQRLSVVEWASAKRAQLVENQ